MSNELIINASPKGLEIALLSDKKLIEFHTEQVNAAFQVGDFYLGKIKKVVPSLNAAFVQIGAEKDAFLTYFDLGPNVLSLLKFTKMMGNKTHKGLYLDKFELEPKTEKTGKVSEVLKANQNVLVQIIKEPISNKGPKITCDISIPGRYFVLVPFSNQVSISKKIGTPEEKKRLLNLVKATKLKNFGIIVRTMAENIPTEELDASLREQIKKWDELVKGMHNAKPKSLVLGEGNRVETLLREIFDSNFGSITVNDETIYNSIKSYLANINMADIDKMLKLYQGKSPIFDTYGVSQKIKSSFGKTVPVTAGAYLVIEHTEALHVIDVNSGNSSFNSKDREENVHQVNLESVNEIARQIRLRDMGGIVVVDFIDVKDADKKADLYKAMRLAMKNDKARHTLLPITKFGLMQITRERVRPEKQIITTETCATCAGTGQMENNSQLVAKVEFQLEYLWQNMNYTKLLMKANPLIVRYFKSGFPSRRLQLWKQHKRWLNMQEDPNLALSEVQFFDSNHQQIISE